MSPANSRSKKSKEGVIGSSDRAGQVSRYRPSTADWTAAVELTWTVFVTSKSLRRAFMVVLSAAARSPRDGGQCRQIPHGAPATRRTVCAAWMRGLAGLCRDLLQL